VPSVEQVPPLVVVIVKLPEGLAHIHLILCGKYVLDTTSNIIHHPGIAAHKGQAEWSGVSLDSLLQRRSNQQHDPQQNEHQMSHADYKQQQN